MKPIPDEKQLEEMLAKISPTQSGRLDQRLSAAPWTPRGMARHRLAQAAVVALLAALVLFVVATPKGNALAQSLLKFFIRAESDTRPAPTVVAVVPSPGQPAASAAAGLFPGARLPFEERCGDVYRPRCSLEEIRSLATFPIQGLKDAPRGLTFEGATGGPQQVVLVYTGENVNGMLTITQQPAAAGQRLSPQVAASAEVEAVTINGAPGEYVQGSWYSVDGSDDVSWTADPFVQSLRWQVGPTLYTMVFRAGKAPGILLDKAALLSLAGQLTANAGDRPADKGLESTETERLAAQAGFTVIQPRRLPGKYVFQGADYTSEHSTVCLYYSYGAGAAPTLAIAQRPAAASGLDDIAIAAVDIDGKTIPIPQVTEPVEIGGAQGGQGLLVSNGVNAGKLCPLEDFLANQALQWQFNGKTFTLFGLVDQYQGGVFISRLEMQRLAESLTGVSTIPGDQLDPGRLLSEQDAKALAGFPVKTPTRMATGVQFDHAVHLAGAIELDRAAGEADKPAEVVNLIYTLAGKPPAAGSGYGFLITQVSGALRPLDEIYGWGGFETVSINGQRGAYRKSCWENVTGDIDCRQELYWDENGVGYGFNLSLPGALAKDELLAIAESMQEIR